MTTVVCWDVDGTLLTTARAGVFAFEQAIRDVCGVEADLMDVPTSGLTDAEVAVSFLTHCGQRATPERVEAVLRRYEQHLPERLHYRKGSVLPGVREALEHLAGRGDVLLLLLTGNTAEGARAKLTHYGLWDFFDGGAFCIDGGVRDAIAQAVRSLAEERLGRPPEAERLYVVGDTPADVRCGKSIGARTIAVASGIYPLDELEACEPWLALPVLPEPREFARLLGVPPAA